MKGYVTIEEGCVENPKKLTPLVSVIVPIYNTEKYLDQALDSLEAQTLKNFEILCVNDGSTDRSRAIMQAHADQDNRIRIIDKPNGGYGSACNVGLREARGTWIAILEPDDWVEPGMYKDMTEYAARFSEQIDIIKTPFYDVLDVDKHNERRYPCGYDRLIKLKKQPTTIYDPELVILLSHHPSIWSALYRREFLLENDIRFPEIPGAGWADNPFMIETYCKAKSIVYLRKAYYNYRTESKEQSEQFAKKNTLLPLERWNDMTDLLDEMGIDDKGVRREHNSRGFLYLSGIVEIVDLSHKEVYDAAVAMFNRMDDDLVFSDPLTPPAWKINYAQMKGVECPPISHMDYYKSIVSKGLGNAFHLGPVQTVRMAVNFLLKRRKRQAIS